jgi:hypothetical protein
MSLRIKSYFDSSIQTAMRQARHEFGEDVMLVTSRIASSEFRYLGDFEVVFAVDEVETGLEAEIPPQPEPPAAGFEKIFRQQLESRFVPVEDTRETTVEGIRSLLVDLGLEPAMTEAIIVLIRSCGPHSGEQTGSTRVPQEPFRSLPAQESAGSHRSTPFSEHAQDWPPNATPARQVPDPYGAARRGPSDSEDRSVLTIPPSSDCVDCETKTDAKNEETAQTSSWQMSIGGERANSPVAAYEVPRVLRTSGSHPQPGLMMMLIAFGVYGIIRGLV